VLRVLRVLKQQMRPDLKDKTVNVILRRFIPAESRAF